MADDEGELLKSVERYYTARVAEHGATARGVDWNSPESQTLRFDQLARLWEGERRVDVIDYGCGYGALVDHLSDSGAPFAYQGYDISDAMIRAARSREGSGRTFTTDEKSLIRSDYAVASGIFNVRLGSSDAAWSDYMRATIDRLAALASKGFAFNALTSYSDPDRRRDDLFYADPLKWFDYCKRTHSRFVTLLHDYPLYEFTLLVRSERP